MIVERIQQQKETELVINKIGLSDRDITQVIDYNMDNTRELVLDIIQMLEDETHTEIYYKNSWINFCEKGNQVDEYYDDEKQLSKANYNLNGCDFLTTAEKNKNIFGNLRKK